MSSQPPARIPWPPLLMAACVLGAWMLGRTAPLAWPGQGDMAARIFGLSIGGGGVLLLAWSVHTLWSASTTVRPDRAVSTLVTAGPYRYRRNPIYLADVMILLGLAELSRNIWLVIAVPLFMAVVTWLAILPEERHLEARFGDQWLDYASRVRRWI